MYDQLKRNTLIEDQPSIIVNESISDLLQADYQDISPVSTVQMSLSEAFSANFTTTENLKPCRFPPRCSVPPSSPEPMEPGAEFENCEEVGERQGEHNPLASSLHDSGERNAYPEPHSVRRSLAPALEGCASPNDAAQVAARPVSEEDVRLVLMCLEQKEQVVQEQGITIARLEKQLALSDGQAYSSEGQASSLEGVKNVAQSEQQVVALQRIVQHQEEIISTMRARHDEQELESQQWVERLKKLSENNEQIAALEALKKLQLQVRDLGIEDVDESWEEEEEGGRKNLVLLQAIEELREEFVSVQSMHVQRGQELQKQLGQLRGHISLQDQVMGQLQEDLQMWQEGRLVAVTAEAATARFEERCRTMLAKQQEHAAELEKKERELDERQRQLDFATLQQREPSPLPDLRQCRFEVASSDGTASPALSSYNPASRSPEHERMDQEEEEERVGQVGCEVQTTAEEEAETANCHVQTEEEEGPAEVDRASSEVQTEAVGSESRHVQTEEEVGPEETREGKDGGEGEEDVTVVGGEGEEEGKGEEGEEATLREQLRTCMKLLERKEGETEELRREMQEQAEVLAKMQSFLQNLTICA